MQRIRSAFRAARTDARISLAVVVLFSLGIGATSAVLSVANSVLRRNPPGMPNAVALKRVYVHTNWTIDGVRMVRSELKYREYDAIKGAATQVPLAAYTAPDTLSGPGVMSDIRVSYAASDYFTLLGVRPARGRFYTADEDAMGSGRDVIVLSHDYWRRAFGSDASVIGRTVEVGGNRPVVIGIAPESFRGVDASPVDAWMPLASRAEAPVRDEPWYRSWATHASLKVLADFSGITPSVWNDVATTALRQAAAGQTQTDTMTSVQAGPLLEAMGPAPSAKPTRATTMLLMIASAMVLVIAAANATGLLLIRAIGRRRDMAVRSALGMSRRRLIGDTILETLVLSVAAGAGALLIGFLGGHALRGWLMPGVEWTSAPFDATVALATIILAFAIGIVVAALTALHASHMDLITVIGLGSDRTGHVRSRMRMILLGTQSALALFLLAGAGLFVKSWISITDIDLGYETDGLTVASVQFRNPAGYVEFRGENHESDLKAGIPAAAERLRAYSSIESVAYASHAPFEGFRLFSFSLPDRAEPPSIGTHPPAILSVSADFFHVTGTKVVRGRAFTSDDDANGDRVIVVNETAALLYWPGEVALGKCMYIGAPGPSLACRTIVGVVKDAHLMKVLEEPIVRVYAPILQAGDHVPGVPHALLVRARPGQDSAMAATVRTVLKSGFPAASRIHVNPLSSMIAPQLHRWRIGATLFTCLGSIALLITATGVFSVVAYGAAMRRQELGVRMALGARSRHIMGTVLNEGMVAVGAGIVIGLVPVLWSARLVAGLLYGTVPHDPAVLIGACCIVLASGLFASLAPVRSALRIHPMTALRGHQ